MKILTVDNLETLGSVVAGSALAAPDPGILDRHRADAHRVVGMDLERAVAALPRGARDVLLLHDVEGYRHEEIADLTGTSVGTSKSQLHRARRLLREALSS